MKTLVNTQSILELREDHRAIEKFLEENQDKVFVCRDPKAYEGDLYEFVMNKFGGYYLATAEEVLNSDSEVVAVFNKEDRLSKNIYKQTKDQALEQEIKEIISYYFGGPYPYNDYSDLIDYTSVKIEGQFLNIWDPSFGLEFIIDDNYIVVEVTYPDWYGAAPLVKKENFKFEKKGGAWVLTEGPEEYEPQYVQDKRLLEKK